MRFMQPLARIYAYEPAPRPFADLKHNVEGFKVATMNMAFGDGTDVVLDTDAFTLGAKCIPPPSSSSDEEVRIKSRTLPQMLKVHDINLEPGLFIKMDCEGAEEFLLKDPEIPYFLKKASVFALEIHPRKGLKGMDYYNWFGRHFLTSHMMEWYYWRAGHLVMYEREFYKKYVK